MVNTDQHELLLLVREYLDAEEAHLIYIPEGDKTHYYLVSKYTFLHILRKGQILDPIFKEEDCTILANKCENEEQRVMVNDLISSLSFVFKPEKPKIHPNRGLVCSIGNNDLHWSSNSKRNSFEECHLFNSWKGILKKVKTGECGMCEEWKTLSTFVEWVKSQPNYDDIVDPTTARVILHAKNFYYSPENCWYDNSVRVSSILE